MAASAAVSPLSFAPHEVLAPFMMAWPKMHRCDQPNLTSFANADSALLPMKGIRLARLCTSNNRLMMHSYSYTAAGCVTWAPFRHLKVEALSTETICASQQITYPKHELSQGPEQILLMLCWPWMIPPVQNTLGSP